jgi:hypothetical protein
MIVKSLLTLIFSLLLFLCGCNHANQRNQERKATITISLSTNDGVIVNNAQVSLRNNKVEASNENVHAITSNDFTIEMIPFGTYSLVVKKDGYVDYANTNFLVNQTSINQHVKLYLIDDYKFQVGDVGPAGGIVFFDKGTRTDGWRFLEVAPASYEFVSEWGTLGYDVAGTSTDMGTGRVNTNLIIKASLSLGEKGNAAQLCAELNVKGFNDWFLPSQGELDIMHLNRVSIDHFDRNKYWSSSQHINDFAFLQIMPNGLQGFSLKSDSLRVRAVRSF